MPAGHVLPEESVAPEPACPDAGLTGETWGAWPVAGYVRSEGAGDIDADGFADIVLRDEEGSFVVYGGVDGTSARTQRLAWLGYEAAIVGDVNGDGADDVAFNPPSIPGAALYAGSAGGLVSYDHVELEEWDGLYFSPHAIGDVNGDGLDDLAVVGFSADNASYSQRLWTFHASVDGMTRASYQAFPDAYWLDLAGAGDVDADGFADVVLWRSDTGALALYRGGPDGVDDDTPSQQLTPASPGDANDIGPAGDVNGDGYADVLVDFAGGEPGTNGPVHLYFGSADGLSEEPAVLSATEGGKSYAPVLVGPADIDGDGFTDVLLTQYEVRGLQHGHVYAYLGSPTGPGAEPELTLPGEYVDRNVRFAHAPGDVNGDGYDDVVVVTPDGEGTVYLGCAPVDADMDGHYSAACWGDDCDDADATRF